MSKKNWKKSFFRRFWRLKFYKWMKYKIIIRPPDRKILAVFGGFRSWKFIKCEKFIKYGFQIKFGMTALILTTNLVAHFIYFHFAPEYPINAESICQHKRQADNCNSEHNRKRLLRWCGIINSQAVQRIRIRDNNVRKQADGKQG